MAPGTDLAGGFVMVMFAASQVLVSGGLLAALLGGAWTVVEMIFDPGGSRDSQWPGVFIKRGFWAVGAGFVAGLISGIGVIVAGSGGF